MKLARFRVNDWESYGLVEGDRVTVIQGSIFGAYTVSQASYPLDRVKLLPPTRPTGFWAVGLNYAAHVAHQEVALDAERIRRDSQVFRPWLKKLIKHRSNMRLTDAALETLAIVAYKQPVIRADVEAIRGVACGDVINRLREIGLIRIAGRAEVIGRPILYGTTRKFLDVFGLAGLDELPPMEALVIKRPAAVEPAEEPEAADSEPQAAGES